MHYRKEGKVWLWHKQETTTDIDTGFSSQILWEREEKLADNTTSCLCNWEDTWPFDHNEISEGKEEEGAALSAKLQGWWESRERDDNLLAFRAPAPFFSRLNIYTFA